MSSEIFVTVLAEKRKDSKLSGVKKYKTSGGSAAYFLNLHIVV